MHVPSMHGAGGCFHCSLLHRSGFVSFFLCRPGPDLDDDGIQCSLPRGGGRWTFLLLHAAIPNNGWNLEKSFFFVDVVGWFWQAGDEGRVLAFGLTGWD
jgi:hypothetical protein